MSPIKQNGEFIRLIENKRPKENFSASATAKGDHQVGEISKNYDGMWQKLEEVSLQDNHPNQIIKSQIQYLKSAESNLTLLLQEHKTAAK